MSLDTWIVFFVSYLVITLAPGPNVLYVIQNAIRHGYKEALLSICANLTCQLIIVILVAAGAGALLAQSPVLFLVLKVIGGVYLIYLGISGLLEKNKGGSDQALPEPTRFISKKSILFKKGFLVSASNPKTVIFLSAFLPQFLSKDSPVAYQFVVMFLTITGIVLGVHLMYSYVAKDLNKRWGNSRLKVLLSKFTNGAFIVFGGSVLLSSRAT